LRHWGFAIIASSITCCVTTTLTYRVSCNGKQFWVYNYGRQFRIEAAFIIPSTIFHIYFFQCC
jgi:hypothetical protein